MNKRFYAIHLLIFCGIFILVFFDWYYPIWITRALEILMIICLCFTGLYLLVFIICITPVFFRCFIKFVKIFINIIFPLLFLVSVLFYLTLLIVMGINYRKYLKYYKNCPFSLDDIDEKMCKKRICLFYNINYNNRYKNQYLCSYNPVDDFKTDKCNNNVCQKIKKENMVCTTAINNLTISYNENLNINPFEKANSFLTTCKQKQNKDLFFCGRTDKPNDYSYVSKSKCNSKKKNVVFIILFLLTILLYPYFLLIGLALAVIIDAQERADRNRRLAMINNLLYGIENTLSRVSTIVSESDNQNQEQSLNQSINFRRENTKVIIVENGTVSEIEKKNKEVNEIFRSQITKNSNCDINNINNRGEENINIEDTITQMNLNNNRLNSI